MYPSAIDSLWSLIAATGTVFSLAVLGEYIAARPAARDPARIPDAADRAVAVDLVRDYILAECARLACHMISLALGVWSLFVPPQPHARTPHAVALFGAAVIVGIMAINALTTANSIRAWLAWRRRYDLVAHGRRRGVARGEPPEG